MTTDYKTLDWLEGAQIDILRGANVLCQYRTPERAEIIKDYERTLLIEMTFIKSEWAKSTICREKFKLRSRKHQWQLAI